MESGSGDGGGRIRSLDERTIQRIAAGEVVERPASVVKELVENALDAGATRIDVTVEGEAGTDRIVVEDDGHGIPPGELSTAVQPHTTSKITHHDDLERGPPSLGFRGEAVHAIGQVSRLTIASRPPGADAGAEIVVDAGEVTDEGPAGIPPGTRVTVEGLFDPVPARRKFLDAAVTERGHVRRIVGHLAVARPDVALSLTINGEERFATLGTGERREAFAAVHGTSVSEDLFDLRTDGPLPGAVDAIGGLISDPERTRSTPEYMTTVVNGRPVVAQALRRPIVQGYGDRLGPDRYPFAVVALEMDGNAFDVNVHPRKHEVQFDDPDGVEGAIRDAIEATLRAEAPVPTGPPRAGEPATATSAGPRPAIDIGAASSGGQQATLPGTADRAAEGSHERLPALRVIGQALEGYVVGEAAESLVLIDQHAADERINYERLRRNVSHGADRQRLAEPLSIALTNEERDVLTANREAVEAVGFAVDAIDGDHVTVTAVPAAVAAVLPRAAMADALQRVLEGLMNRDDGEAILDVLDPVLADLACHPAITANQSLTEGAIATLVQDLDRCESPWTCPHGRPTMVEVDADELDARFERDYPGAQPCRRWDLADDAG